MFAQYQPDPQGHFLIFVTDIISETKSQFPHLEIRALTPLLAFTGLSWRIVRKHRQEHLTAGATSG